jgi:hypothetical protein
VTDLSDPSPSGRRAAANDAVDTVDADLRRAIRRTTLIRQWFYAVVLLVALAGQVSGAMRVLSIPMVWAIPAVAGIELGGVVVLASADVRRRLGERATASRLLSALIACWAVAFNWLAHPDHLVGGFYVAMSALGYLVWLIHTEAQRRDRLRATGDLPPTTPAYPIAEHWLRHPLLTSRAKSLAKADPGLGLYGSLAAARDQIRHQRRRRAIAAVLHRKIRAAVDPLTADIATSVYDLDEIATRLAAQADYQTLTALIGADLAPARLAAASTTPAEHTPSGPARTTGLAPSAPSSATDPPPDEAQHGRQPPLDVPAGVSSPVGPAGTRQAPEPTRAAAYTPTSEEDIVMYQTWQRGLADGHEPSGVDLARAGGRADDATGVGRRAARRYREAHTHNRHSTSQAPRLPTMDAT